MFDRADCRYTDLQSRTDIGRDAALPDGSRAAPGRDLGT